MRKISQEKLQEILETHKLWVESGGKKSYWANLSKVDFTGFDFSGVNLTSVVIYESNLRGVNLQGANLTRAYFSESDLRGANLSGANLTRAYFSRTNLREADLRVATAKGCWIGGARFSLPRERARLMMLGAVEK